MKKADKAAAREYWEQTRADEYKAKCIEDARSKLYYASRKPQFPTSLRDIGGSSKLDETLQAARVMLEEAYRMFELEFPEE